MNTGGPGAAVRVTSSRQRADEWAVVLAAAGIPHWTRQRLDGWALIVPPDDAASALASLDAYDAEAVAARAREAAPTRPFTIVGLVVALGLLGFFAITGPREAHSAWFERGSADAALIVAGILLVYPATNLDLIALALVGGVAAMQLLLKPAPQPQ